MRILIRFLAVAFIISISSNAKAQIMTNDLFLLKFGYIPLNTASFDSGSEVEGADLKDAEIKNIKLKGFNYAARAEYYLIFGIFSLGLGIEYQKISIESFVYNLAPETYDDTETESFENDFLMPVITLKFMVFNGLYTGLGTAQKYLLSTDSAGIEDAEGSSVKFKKRMDTWASFIIGYNLHAAGGVFFDFEARFGYNITNRQYSKMEAVYIDTATNSITSAKHTFTPKQAYDAALYIGVGFSPRGPGY